MGLHIGVAGSEKRLDALQGQHFNFIGKLATAIIAPSGVALGVLIGQHRALRFKHRLRDDILRGNQFDLTLLAGQLLV